MPRSGLQRKRAAAALSQAGRAGPDQPIRAIQPAGRTRRPPAKIVIKNHKPINLKPVGLIRGDHDVVGDDDNNDYDTKSFDHSLFDNLQTQ